MNTLRLKGDKRLRDRLMVPDRYSHNHKLVSAPGGYRHRLDEAGRTDPGHPASLHEIYRGAIASGAEAVNIHSIYVASSWRNQYQPDIVKLLRSVGHSVYDFRNPPGKAGFGWEELDPDWQEWNVAKYRHALRHPIAEDGFKSDMGALAQAEIIVLLLPSGRSAHVEAAWACGRGKPVIVHIPEPCEPELMYKLFNAITCDDVELLELLAQHTAQIGELSLGERVLKP